MEKEIFIENFICQIMASYAAVKYDDNCHYGWREKEQYMQYEDALLLANQAWDRIQEFKQ